MSGSSRPITQSQVVDLMYFGVSPSRYTRSATAFSNDLHFLRLDGSAGTGQLRKHMPLARHFVHGGLARLYVASFCMVPCMLMRTLAGRPFLKGT